MTASQALQIAFEDKETIHFIQVNFSRAEERPQIITQKWKSKSDHKNKWKVAIIEKIPCFFDQRRKFLNLILLEIDSLQRKILSRQFYKNIYISELKGILSYNRR